jgi:hypothetical protein
MIKLRDVETKNVLGVINDEQLQFLMDQLEEESETDTDYYLNTSTLDLLEQNGADPELMSILRKGLGDREAMEIEWSRV